MKPPFRSFLFYKHYYLAQLGELMKDYTTKNREAQGVKNSYFN